jgi:hypothetical protein
MKLSQRMYFKQHHHQVMRLLDGGAMTDFRGTAKNGIA